MPRFSSILVICASLPIAMMAARSAHAEDGAAAAAIIGGIAAGTALGAAVAAPHTDEAPPLLENDSEEPSPAIAIAPEWTDERDCHWIGRRFWDDDQEEWVYRRIQVCE